MKKRYYIAYGSNLNLQQMRMRCPDARVIGTGEIKDYELLFKGSLTGSYLTIEKCKGGRVPVAVWETTEADEAALDRYEGFPTFYYKSEMELDIKDLRPGRVHRRNCYIYIMHEDRQIRVPSYMYIDIALQDTEPSDLMRRYFSKLSKTVGGFAMKNNVAQLSICPRCGRLYYGTPALSRGDNQTFVCPDCGTREALESIGVNKAEQEKILDTIHRTMHP